MCTIQIRCDTVHVDKSKHVRLYAVDNLKINYTIVC